MIKTRVEVSVEKEMGRGDVASAMALRLQATSHTTGFYIRGPRSCGHTRAKTVVNLAILLRCKSTSLIEELCAQDV